MSTALTLPKVYCPECSVDLAVQEIQGTTAILFCRNSGCSSFFALKALETTPVELVDVPS